MRWVWVAFLLFLTPIAYSFTFGTFYSSNYARLMPGESRTFHFYVFGDEGLNVKIQAENPNFYVALYPGTSVRIERGCYGQKWTMYRGKYEPACRIDVKVTPKTTIKNGRYRVNAYATAVEPSGNNGITMSVGQTRQIPFDIDVHGALPFIGPINYSVVKPVARVVFNSIGSSVPSNAISRPLGASTINFVGSKNNAGNGKHETTNLPSSPITALATEKHSGITSWIVVIMSLVVVAILIRMVTL